MVFIPIPERHRGLSFDNLEVNHKNGIKDCNEVHNLEWVSTQENLEHYYSELDPLRRHVVLIKNQATGDVSEVSSIYAASKHAFIPRVVMRKHLLSVFAGAIVHNGYRCKLDDGTGWPEVLNGGTMVPQIHPASEVRLGFSYDIS